MKSPCLSLLQVTDLHILSTAESALLGVKTEHYSMQYWNMLLIYARITMQFC